jgi:hypothetical protein
MLFNCIDNFYKPHDLGLMTVHCLNFHFNSTHQSLTNYFGGDRLKGYPCYETPDLKSDDNLLNPYNIFKNTFENHLNTELLHVKTFFRKTKLAELKASPCWGQYKPHRDHDADFAGVIYFNSNSFDDGTNFYCNEHDYEPTASIGARLNRCIFYDINTWHSPKMKQVVEERWVQPFFAITKKETLEKHMELKNGT